MHDTTFLQTDTSTSIFICVLADTEYRYRYFLVLVSTKVQLIWRQILFYPLQIMSSLWYKIKSASKLIALSWRPNLRSIGTRYRQVHKQKYSYSYRFVKKWYRCIPNFVAIS